MEMIGGGRGGEHMYARECAHTHTHTHTHTYIYIYIYIYIYTYTHTHTITHTHQQGVCGRRAGVGAG